MVKLTPKAARALRGITQEEMAKRIGISAVSLNRKENGMRDFKAPEMEKFLQVLDLQDGDVDFVCHDCTKKWKHTQPNK